MQNDHPNRLENPPQSQIELIWDGGVVAVVDKPAGLPTQAPKDFDSLETRIRVQFADRGQYFAFPHRLDRPVGGLILVAFQKRAARLLGSQFESRKIEKQYLAWVNGEVQPETTEWTDHLRKIPDQAKAEICGSDSSQAKLAQTLVERLRYDESHHCSLVKLHPLTGRMHQLRVQSSHRGHNILGDTLYAPTTSEKGSRPQWIQSLTQDPTRSNHTTGAERTEVDRSKSPTGSNQTEDWIALRAHSIRFFDPRNSLPVCVSANSDWITADGGE